MIRALCSTGPRQIVREGSLLSFPLLSASSSASTSYSYSSMPMTSSVISGRRSFGGANEEIEVSRSQSAAQAELTTPRRQRLNNPTLPPPPSTTTPTDDASQKKKRKKVERDELPLNVRQQPSASSGKGKGSFQANSDKIDLGGGGSGSSGFPKKQRTQLRQGQFAKPRGFDGAKRGAGAGVKGKRGSDVEPVWGKQGDAREWDVGKDETEDDSDAFEDGSDSDSDDVADLLVTSAHGKSRGDRAKFEDAVGSLFEQAKEPSGADRAIEEAEMQWDDGGAGPAVATKGPERKKRRKDQRK